MGLGGLLTWTAAVREISKQLEEDVRILPCEGDGRNISKIVRSPVFVNNPYVTDNIKDPDQRVFPMWLNNPSTNYCKNDTNMIATHRYDKHIIEQICEFYGIDNPELKCELYFSKPEKEKIENLTSGLDPGFLTIEPFSKTNYTPNRVYPFEKWQTIVDALKEQVEIVQLGTSQSPLLSGVTDFRGITSFRTAAGVIGESRLFLSSEGGLVHAATAVETKSVVIITGYQHPRMISYPQNININIASHGPCGLKIECPECKEDRENHNPDEIIEKVKKTLLDT